MLLDKKAIKDNSTVYRYDPRAFFSIDGERYPA